MSISFHSIQCIPNHKSHSASDILFRGIENGSLLV